MMTAAVLVYARDRYMAKGLPPGGAIALSAVLYSESKLDPGSQGYQSRETPGVLNPHGAYGIASWNGPRQQALLDFATKHNLPVKDLGTQLDFVLNEMGNKYPSSWAAIRSSASYRSIVRILVDEYENPKDKQKEIDGALKIAAELAALPPQQAPPTPIPQVPTPQIPPVILPVPAPPAGLPPVSATEAGLDAAILDNIGAWLDVLRPQRAAIDRRITALETAAADFGKLAPMIIPMVLPKPTAGPPVTTQRITMNPQIAAILRSILLAIGGGAVSKGIIDQSTLVSLVGAVVTLASAGWSFLGHSKSSIIAAAAALPEVQKIVAPPAISDSPKFALNPKVVSH